MGALIQNPPLPLRYARIEGVRVARKTRAEGLSLALLTFALAILMASSHCSAQVFTVEPQRVPPAFRDLTVISPTSVPLSSKPITTWDSEELIRAFQSTKAYDVRPLPMGHHGLKLRANGHLNPEGQAYVNDLEKHGISAKPGDLLIITKFEVKKKSLVFEFNGGPQKHHLLQHIEIGGGIGMVPMSQGNGQIARGSELILTFDKFVPDLTSDQVKALIAPVLNFSKKTPVVAYADTLPPKLKEAVLHHHVLVGMNKVMVLHTLGLPYMKDHEQENNQLSEIWIYGRVPHTVRFVHFQGDRVVRLVIAEVGKPMIVRTKDQTGGYFNGRFIHHVWLGDAPPPGTQQAQASSPAPTLRKPGEKLPNVVDKQHQLKPVKFPKNEQKGKKPEPAPIPPPPGQSAGDMLPNEQPMAIPPPPIQHDGP